MSGKHGHATRFVVVTNVEGKGSADAVLAIWLGSKPPSEDLKKGLLG